MKRLLKFFKWLIIIIAVLCLGLWVSGYGYILRGVTMTYLVGQTGPGIDERQSFYNDTVRASSHPQEWLEHERFGSIVLSDDVIEKMEAINSVSFLVIKDQQLLFEKYWDGFDQDHPTNSFSAIKSAVSLLIGIAIEEGKIKSLDQKVGEFLPEFTRNGKENISIRHLLTMSSGLDWHESGANPFSHAAEGYYGSDLTGLINSLTAIESPGVSFNYQSGNTQILGLILREATGKPIARYMEEKIWQNIGSTHNAYWNLDSEDGIAKAFCCFYATPRDYARLGQLILNKGEWQGKQIISKNYLRECFTAADLTWNDKPLSKYGLHWWLLNYRDLDITYARGIAGQYIITIPAHNLVIVRTGWMRAEVDEDGHPTDIYTYVDAALKMIENEF